MHMQMYSRLRGKVEEGVALLRECRVSGLTLTVRMYPL